MFSNQAKASGNRHVRRAAYRLGDKVSSTRVGNCNGPFDGNRRKTAGFRKKPADINRVSPNLRRLAAARSSRFRSRGTQLTGHNRPDVGHYRQLTFC